MPKDPAYVTLIVNRVSSADNRWKDFDLTIRLKRRFEAQHHHQSKAQHHHQSKAFD